MHALNLKNSIGFMTLLYLHGARNMRVAESSQSYLVVLSVPNFRWSRLADCMAHAVAAPQLSVKVFVAEMLFAEQ
jgi:hypothetical protein